LTYFLQAVRRKRQANQLIRTALANGWTLLPTHCRAAKSAIGDFGDLNTVMGVANLLNNAVSNDGRYTYAQLSDTPSPLERSSGGQKKKRTRGSARIEPKAGAQARA